MDRAKELVLKLVDRSLSDAEFAELQEIMRSDAELRAYYHRTIEIDQALEKMSLSELDATVPAARPTGGNGTLLWRNVGWLAAAIAIALLVLSQRQQSFDVVLKSSEQADWRGASLMVGERLGSRMMQLKNGKIELAFPTSTAVVIQAPAFFQVVADDTLVVAQGAVTVTHSGTPGSFSLETPTGTLRDLGTKFGVSIGSSNSESFVLTHVFDGQVAFENSSVEEEVIFGDGDYVEIRGVGENRPVTLLSDDPNAYLIPLTPPGDSGPAERRNLALHKPVESSGFWSNHKTELFPPSNVNDGRLDDTGVPRDWSFWLLPEKSTGWVMIDLEAVELISSIDIQNTHNRWYDDRAAKDFRIETSIDGDAFSPLIDGELAVPSKHETIPFETFEFDPVRARYVKLYIDTYKQSGGGINEIRIYE